MNYLDELVAGARDRVTRARRERPEVALRELVGEMAAPPGFVRALRGPGVAVIAEVKRASPSAGTFDADLDASERARAYRDGGAAAISVLTEPTRFAGSLDDLAAVAQLATPTLRKDFIVEPYQVWEARAAGASAVLLIVAALATGELEELLGTCDEAGLDALVEVHDESEADAAVRAGSATIGINARDLRTFELDRRAFARIRPRLPEGVVAVAESGIRGPEDVVRVGREGADAVLVGTALVTSQDPRGAVALLVSAGATPLTATEYR